jgi:isoprenylcysteine carboxyl methyltransferase (ICMT) family protein YpbQ
MNGNQDYNNEENLYNQHVVESGSKAVMGFTMMILFWYLFLIRWMWRKNKFLAIGVWLGTWMLFSVANYIPLTGMTEPPTRRCIPYQNPETGKFTCHYK